jgi:Trypsin-co-occurring domain 1
MGSDEISAAAEAPSTRAETKARLVPISLGEVEIFVEQVGEPPEIEGSADIYVATSPREALESALDFTRSFLASVGDRLAELREKTTPDELRVELSFTFEAKGKASVVPVLVTGEAGTKSGITVTAVWRPTEAD